MLGRRDDNRGCSSRQPVALLLPPSPTGPAPSSRSPRCCRACRAGGRRPRVRTSSRPRPPPARLAPARPPPLGPAAVGGLWVGGLGQEGARHGEAGKGRRGQRVTERCGAGGQGGRRCQRRRGGIPLSAGPLPLEASLQVIRAFPIPCPANKPPGTAPAAPQRPQRGMPAPAPAADSEPSAREAGREEGKRVPWACGERSRPCTLCP